MKKGNKATTNISIAMIVAEYHRSISRLWEKTALKEIVFENTWMFVIFSRTSEGCSKWNLQNILPHRM